MTSVVSEKDERKIGGKYESRLGAEILSKVRCQRTESQKVRVCLREIERECA